MATPKIFVVLAIILSSYCYGMANENSTATTPGIRGSGASTGRVVENRAGGRRERPVDAEESTNINSTIPRREEDVIRIEKRLLWRNETPLDDDFANDVTDSENDRRPHDGIRPGLISTSLDRFDELGRDDWEGEKSVADTPDADVAGTTIEAGMGDNANSDRDGNGNGDETIETAINTDDGNGNTEGDGDGIEGDKIDDRNNEDGDEMFKDDLVEDYYDYFSNSTYGFDSEFNNETLSLTHSKDCFWSVMTGTGCSTMTIGEIVNGYQHEYLVADGECRYNDFLGYYRAGCKRQFLDSSQWLAKAKIVLTEVFCTDPMCSMGCLEESVVRSNSEYSSNFCYRSNFYKSDDGSFEMDTKKLKDLDFSYEFVGGCLEYENCNVIE